MNNGSEHFIRDFADCLVLNERPSNWTVLATASRRLYIVQSDIRPRRSKECSLVRNNNFISIDNDHDDESATLLTWIWKHVNIA